MASGEQASVLLLGGCLLGNVWDRALAESALERASVVAVTGHGGQTLAYADVVLPAHVSYERSGTVTNIEGRVSALTPKVVAPGAAWDDVAIAAELAEEFGHHLGLTSIEATTALIESTTGYPTYQALSAGTEGVVIGARAVATAPVMDPAAFPGIRAVSHLGFAASSTAHDAIEVTSPAMATPLALVNVSAGLELPSVANDAYATSLVVQRRLYDNGVAMQGSASLHNLRATAEVTMNSLDLDGLGVADGAAITLKGAHGDVAVSVRSDAQLARGVAVIPFGAVESPFGVLADSTALVTSVRMESR
jgi:predicted molibdopterin-dependent oxidoreductase YjgC